MTENEKVSTPPDVAGVIEGLHNLERALSINALNVYQMTPRVSAAAEALTTLSARLVEVQTGHAAARENFLTMQGAADKLRQRAEAAESEATRLRGELARVERETIERAAKVADAEAFAIEDEERDCRTWGGPDPRGEHVAEQNLARARNLRSLAVAIRNLEPRHD